HSIATILSQYCAIFEAYHFLSQFQVLRQKSVAILTYWIRRDIHARYRKTHQIIKAASRSAG
ncbi:MAG: hypothetical protein ACXWVX_09690, partial [Sulfuricurvum sp.]